MKTQNALFLLFIIIGLASCSKNLPTQAKKPSIADTCETIEYVAAKIMHHPTDDPNDIWLVGYNRFLEDELGFRYQFEILVGTIDGNCQKVEINMWSTSPDRYETYAYIDCTGEIETMFGFEEDLDVLASDPYFEKCLPTEIQKEVQKLIEYGKTLPNLSGEQVSKNK